MAYGRRASIAAIKEAMAAPPPPPPPPAPKMARTFANDVADAQRRIAGVITKDIKNVLDAYKKIDEHHERERLKAVKAQKQAAKRARREAEREAYRLANPGAASPTKSQHSEGGESAVSGHSGYDSDADSTTSVDTTASMRAMRLKAQQAQILKYDQTTGTFTFTYCLLCPARRRSSPPSYGDASVRGVLPRRFR